MTQRRCMTRRKLLRTSKAVIAAGVAITAGGLVSFEDANVRHAELRSLLIVFVGLAAVVVGVLSVAMCKIATAAIAPRLAAALLEDEMPAGPPTSQLRLLTPELPRHRLHG